MSGTLKTVKAQLKAENKMAWLALMVFLPVMIIFFHYITHTAVLEQIAEYGSLENIPEDEFVGGPVPVFTMALGGFIGGFGAVLFSISNLALQHQQTRKSIRRAYLLCSASIAVFITVLMVGSVAAAEKLFPYAAGGQPHIIAAILGKSVPDGIVSYLWLAADCISVGLIACVLVAVIVFTFTRFGPAAGITYCILGTIVTVVVLVNAAVNCEKYVIGIAVGGIFLLLCLAFYLLSKTITLDRKGKGMNAKKA